MNELEKIKMWEHLKSETSKIYDPKTRSLYYRAFLARASNEWGFNPENPVCGQKNTVKIDDWEQDFMQDIQDTITYGLDIREEKRKKTLDETKKNIKNMLRQGYNLSDVPDDIRTPFIEKMWFKCMYEIGDELSKAADDLTGERK